MPAVRVYDDDRALPVTGNAQYLELPATPWYSGRGWRNPHWHDPFVEGGFDAEGRFVHLSPIDLAKMSACFRQRVIAFFLERKLLDERRAKNMLAWTHSGFSVDASIRIPATSARTSEALAQYVVRAPVSVRNLLLDEEGTDTVLYRAPYKEYSPHYPHPGSTASRPHRP